MRATIVLINLGLSAVGGILGNLIAAYIQQDRWGNFFTSGRIVGSVIGLIVVVLILAWIDVASRRPTPTPPRNRSGQIERNMQIGNPIISVLKGTNVIGNIQIGGGRIEVNDGTPSNRHQP